MEQDKKIGNSQGPLDQSVMDELMAIDPVLAEARRVSGAAYAVPDGYFNAFPASIAALAALEDAPRSMPFEVPAGYFEGLAGKVLARVRQAPAMLPELADLPKAHRPVYNLLSDPDFIASRSRKPEPKPILARLVNMSRWQNVAAAAAMALIALGLGSYLWETRAGHGTVVATAQEHRQLSQLSENDIDAYLLDQPVDLDAAAPATAVPSVEQLVSNLTDQELSQYLQENEHFPAQSGG